MAYHLILLIKLCSCFNLRPSLVNKSFTDGNAVIDIVNYRNEKNEIIVDRSARRKRRSNLILPTELVGSNYFVSSENNGYKWFVVSWSNDESCKTIDHQISYLLDSCIAEQNGKLHFDLRQIVFTTEV
jgi:hypothetical protein